MQHNPPTLNLIDSFKLRKAAQYLQALKHPVKRQILQLLTDKTQLSVQDIQDALQLEQAIISQHLATLRKLQFVTATRISRNIVYKVCLPKIVEKQDAIELVIHK